jgi:hypothetical protein
MRTTKRYAEDGTLVITIRANAEDGAVIIAGLDAVAADLERRRAADPDDSAQASTPEGAPGPRQQGFHLTLHVDRRLDVVTADGVPVLHHPAPPWGDPAALDGTGGVTAAALPADHCDARIDVG